ncbi:UNVERIFIED_CONTAM: hypothetical protein Cloal_2859 [Acetivibrio alkalicellulosi]
MSFLSLIIEKKIRIKNETKTRGVKVLDYRKVLPQPSNH